MAINFKRLEEIAKALKPVHQSGKSFHVTVVYRKNKMLCIANNNYNKNHPYHKFGEYAATKGGDYMAGIHSETAALIKLGLEDCSDLTFVNLRIDNNGNPAISRPCDNCQRVLDQIGYKKIWFYDGKQYVHQ
jgi:hypothetical protein